jgi:tape measure domain-containing protein
MANETIRARIEVILKGTEQVESLKNAVRQLQTTASPAAADLDRLKNAAMQLGNASDRTENDLRRSISALKDVRAQLSLTDREYQKLTGTINKYQAQLDKATGAQQRGGRGMQFAQTAGAVAASGVFGGPEGLIGAGIGAFFGPGGALAGGAIGAQVGQIRQQLGATATLAADLEKQRTALRLVLRDTAEYDSAINFLAKTSKDYAIPQDQLIKGFTQLAASVKGAGGSINDTKTAFQGVTAGIRGTGGSLENLDAALLATSQVFSKGKVTAEELRGQIGERLPGAFTLFAQSLGKTPQELDKALERGEVSLQDFLTFSKTVFGEYGQNAKIIADSPAAAGDRLQTNLKNLGESVGRLLQPVGAAFQNTFSEIVKYIDTAARKLGDFLGLNRSNTEKIGDLNNTIITQQKAIERERKKLSMGIVNKEAADYSIRLFEERIVKAKAELGLLRSLDKATSNQRRDGLSGTTPKGDLDKDALAKARKEAERLAAEQQRLDEAVAKAEIQLSQTVFNNQIELIKKRYDYEQERIQMQRDIWAGTFEGIRSESARAANDFVSRLEQIRQRTREATLGVVVAEQNAAFNARMEAVTGQGLSGGGVPVSSTGIVARTGNTGDSTGAHLDLRWGDGRPITKADADKYFLVNGKAPSSFGVTSPYGPRNLFGRSFHRGIDFGTPAGSALTLKGGATFGRNLGNTGAGGYAIEVMTPEGTMRALHLMANSAVRSAPVGVAAQTRRNVAAAGKAGSGSAEVQQANAMLGLDVAQSNFLLQSAGVQYIQQRTQGLRDEAKALEDGNALLLKRMQLEQSGMRPELVDAQVKIADIEQKRADRIAGINENILKNQYDPEAVAAFRVEIEETNAVYDRQIAAINALAQAQTASGVALANYIGQLKLQLSELTNVENVLITIGQTVEGQISGAMSTAVTSVVTGSGSIKQALSDMFANIGQSFVKMAADIIAKQLVMITLQTVLKALGMGFSGGSAGGGVDRIANFNAGVAAYGFADGGIMTSRGSVPLKKYARGGVANSPQMALFGEGSTPEAFVPLPDGRRIPVSLKSQDKMNEIMGRSPVQQQAPTLNMTFQTTSIGGVEYVSRDQLEAAMAETRKAASRDGASRGMSMTLDRLQQSPTTRRQVGLR